MTMFESSGSSSESDDDDSDSNRSGSASPLSSVMEDAYLIKDSLCAGLFCTKIGAGTK